MDVGMKRCLVLGEATIEADWVHERYGRGNTIVFLRPDANRNGFEGDSVEPMLRPGQEGELADRGFGAARRFSRAIGHGELLDGIDWAEACRDDNRLVFMRNLFFGYDLARILKAKGFEQVVYLGKTDYPSFSPAQALVTALDVLLGDALQKVMPRQSDKGNFSKLVGKLGSRIRRKVLGGKVMPDGGACRRVVSVLGTTEWERFSGQLEELAAGYGGDYEFWNLGMVGETLREWSKAQSVAVRTVPYPQTTDKDIQSFFDRKWTDWVNEGRRRFAEEWDCELFLRDELNGYFEPLVHYTMAYAAQWGRTLRGFLSVAKPDWLIGSSASTYMCALPFHVARTLGIPSVALPVAYVTAIRDVVASDYLACEDRLQSENYRASFPADERIIYCRGASNRLTYEVAGSRGEGGAAGRTVAILTALPLMTLETGLPPLDVEEFAGTLDALCEPPAKLKGLRFVFKSHPRFDVGPLLERHKGGLASNVRVMAAKESLADLLEQAWVVVVWDHYGSVVAEAAASAKPLLFLYCSHFYAPELEMKALDAGMEITGVADFWECLAKLERDEGFYREMMQRARDFKASWLAKSEARLTETLKARSENRLGDVTTN